MSQRTIDTHSHILTQETAALLSKAGVPVTITPVDAEYATLDVAGVAYRPFPTGGFDIPRRLRDMDAGRHRRACALGHAADLSLQSGRDTGVATSAIQNDQIAKHIAAHPKRFMGIATLPMQAPAKAADELKRAMTKLGLKGTMFASNIMGKNLGRSEFRTHLGDGRGTRCVYFHPSEQCRRRRPAEILLPAKSYRQSARHHHRRRLSFVRRRDSIAIRN